MVCNDSNVSGAMGKSMVKNDVLTIKFNFHKNIFFIYLVSMVVNTFLFLSKTEDEPNVAVMMPAILVIVFGILAFYKYKYLMNLLKQFAGWENILI